MGIVPGTDSQQWDPGMTSALHLDIVIPTYKRPALLEKTLTSILAARAPDAMTYGVIVVDNNSNDATGDLVESYMARFEGRLRYVLETSQGRSHAINAGIKASTADLIGMIDDDEQVEASWLTEIERNFADASLDFLGGPCVPDWGALSPPDWLPQSHGGLIGWIVPSERDFDYGGDNHAYMVGGNAVIRRAVFERIGLYHIGLGRTKTNANGGEDLEIFGRLMAAGCKGRYCASLIIYHHIPAERLDPRFFRKRSFWDGVSIGYISRSHREPVPHVAGVPRHFIRTVGEGILKRMSPKGQPRAAAFADELRFYELIGRFYGRFVYAG